MSDNSRNLNLTADEIEIIRMIRELSAGLEKLDFSDPLSTKAEFLQSEIDKLEEKLDQARDNTLIR
jgi:outer membrane murein-binding lipoprotein Lpp